MSHSQFHCIKLFILRHAWLNLWDKHMTTGRINQVTTERAKASIKTINTFSTHATSYWQVFEARFQMRLAFITLNWEYGWVLQACGWHVRRVLAKRRILNTLYLVPQSHKFRVSSPCPEDKDHYPKWRLPVTSQLWKSNIVTADLRVVKCKQV